MIDRSILNQFDRQVLSRLEALGRRLRLYVIADGLAILSLATIASIFITLLVDHTFWLGRDMRFTQLVTLLAAMGAIAWRYVFLPARTPIRNDDLAVLVEKNFPQLESRLVTAVEFATSAGAELRHSEAMIQSVMSQVQDQTSGLHFPDTLAHSRFQKAGCITLGSLALIIAASLIQGPTMRLWFSRNVLLQNEDWPQRNRLVVEGLTDGRLVTPRGDDVTVSVAVPEGFTAPRQAFIDYETESGIQGREQMPAIRGETTRFEYSVDRIRESQACTASGGDATPEVFRIEVVDRPRVSRVAISVVPPAYTGLTPYELRQGQTVVETLIGSEIQFHIDTNKPVVEAVLLVEAGSDPQSLGPAERIGPQSFLAKCHPEKSENFYFRLTDEMGLLNSGEHVSPVRFSVRLVADKPPKVTLQVKGAGEMLTTQAVLPIELEFSDAYGLASARLIHQSSHEGSTPEAEPLSGFEIGAKTLSRELDWSVASHSLTEGDRLTIHAEATDADNVSGPNVGQSAPTAFRIVTADELQADLSRREQEYRQDFERILRLQEELYADFLSQIQKKATEPGDLERSRNLRQLARRQRDQAGRLNALRLQFNQVLSELRINQMADAAIEERLGNAIIARLEALSRSEMPLGAEQLEETADSRASDVLQMARDTQDRIREQMQIILASMLKWERFQEAITLLRDVMKLQRDVSQETEKRIEEDIFGTDGKPDSSKE